MHTMRLRRNQIKLGAIIPRRVRACLFPKHPSVPLVCNILQFCTILLLLTHILTPSITHIDQLPRQSPLISNHFDFFVSIYSYDRPRQLLALLRDIATQAQVAQVSVAVNVIDDNSYGCVFPPTNDNFYDLSSSNTSPPHLLQMDVAMQSPVHCSARGRFREVERFMHQQGWKMFVSKYHQGRKRYWYLIHVAHMLLRPVSADYFLFLADDCRLSSQFFNTVSALWDTIHDPQKLTLMLHSDFRPLNSNATRDLIQSIDEDIEKIEWVEATNFICSREYLQFMNWSFPRVPFERWKSDPTVSSGVRATVSQLLNLSAMGMYRTKQSFIAHIGTSHSRLNAQMQDLASSELLTRRFVDGEKDYTRLREISSTVTASIASQWNREASLHAAVHSLSPQVDHINVYLNDYDSVPTFLQAPYITVKRSQTAHGNMGDTAKFLWSNNCTTDFYLTADDDIIYPSDYVEKLISFWRSYTSPVIVGVHGVRIREDLLRPKVGDGRGYYRSRDVWSAFVSVREAVNVHILGTGTLMYRRSDIGQLDLARMFPHTNMADIWFGIIAQRLGIGMMTVPHEKGWLRQVPGTSSGSIFKSMSGSLSVQDRQTSAAKEACPWRLIAAGRRRV